MLACSYLLHKKRSAQAGEKEVKRQNDESVSKYRGCESESMVPWKRENRRWIQGTHEQGAENAKEALNEWAAWWVTESAEETGPMNVCARNPKLKFYLAPSLTHFSEWTEHADNKRLHMNNTIKHLNFRYTAPGWEMIIWVLCRVCTGMWLSLKDLE